MKSCPTCNRTFEDTFTFCLIDGSVLSAPFEPAAGKSSKRNRGPRPAKKTEVLKAETVTLPPPGVDPPANLNRNAIPRETAPPRDADTDSSLPSTTREPIPPPATDSQPRLQSFVRSALTQWSYGIRGLVGVILSVIYFIHHEPDLRNLMASLGVFALVGGILALIAGGQTVAGRQRESLIMIEGLISVLIGLQLCLALFAPPIELGFWMLATGILQLITASRLRTLVAAWWLLTLAGVVSVVVGLILLPYLTGFGRGDRFQGALLLICTYMLVAGALLLLFGIRLRSAKTTSAG